MKIQEVIVVEGKADTEVLRHAVEAVSYTHLTLPTT